MIRFERLLSRYRAKKNGSINGELMVAGNANAKVENLMMQVRFPESELSHAIRGLDHKDYDLIFDNWERSETNHPSDEKPK